MTMGPVIFALVGILAAAGYAVWTRTRTPEERARLLFRGGDNAGLTPERAAAIAPSITALERADHPGVNIGDGATTQIRTHRGERFVILGRNIPNVTLKWEYPDGRGGWASESLPEDENTETVVRFTIPTRASAGSRRVSVWLNDYGDHTYMAALYHFRVV